MRAAKRARLQAGVALGATPTFAPVAAGIALTENPNRGKRHAGNLAFMAERANAGNGETRASFMAELQRAQSRAYSPLTVSHPLTKTRFPRRASDRSQYTI